MAERSVLVVSASAGMGHVRAGEALRWAFVERGLECEHVDILVLGPRWVRAAYGGGFRLLAGRAPALWRGLYVLSDGPDEDEARWGPAAHRLLFNRSPDCFRHIAGQRVCARISCQHSSQVDGRVFHRSRSS